MAWLAAQARELKHGTPAAGLGTLAALPVAAASDPGAAAAAPATATTYLGAHLDQIQYAHFRGAGYPISSGTGESANKVVVEARLKGAGMHWSAAHVDPMVALRLRSPARRRAPVPLPIHRSVPTHRRKTIVTGRPMPAHPWKLVPCLPRSRTAPAAHPEL